MQSPPPVEALSSPSGRELGRSALPEATELALLQYLASERTDPHAKAFALYANDRPELFGSVKKGATRSEKKLREAVNSRKGYLKRTPSALAHALQQRNFVLPQSIVNSHRNPQDEVPPTPPRRPRQQLKLSAKQLQFNMAASTNDLMLSTTINVDLDQPWRQTVDGILVFLVPSEQVSDSEQVAKVQMLM